MYCIEPLLVKSCLTYLPLAYEEGLVYNIPFLKILFCVEINGWSLYDVRAAQLKAQKAGTVTGTSR